MKVQNKEHLDRLQSRTGLLAEGWFNSRHGHRENICTDWHEAHDLGISGKHLGCLGSSLRGHFSCCFRTPPLPPAQEESLGAQVTCLRSDCVNTLTYKQAQPHAPTEFKGCNVRSGCPANDKVNVFLTLLQHIWSELKTGQLSLSCTHAAGVRNAITLR